MRWLKIVTYLCFFVDILIWLINKLFFSSFFVFVFGFCFFVKLFLNILPTLISKWSFYKFKFILFFLAIFSIFIIFWVFFHFCWPWIKYKKWYCSIFQFLSQFSKYSKFLNFFFDEKIQKLATKNFYSNLFFVFLLSLFFLFVFFLHFYLFWFLLLFLIVIFYKFWKLFERLLNNFWYSQLMLINNAFHL